MTNQPVGPALRRRLLAKELVKLREAAGLKPPAVAELMRCDRTQISHYEGGRRVPTYPALVLLLDIYGVSDRLEELTEWMDLANQRGWWDITGLSHLTKLYIGLENDAVRARSFAQELAPGLVQCVGYAQALEVRHGSTEAEIDSAVSVRMKRQERIGTGLSVEVVASEALLRRTLNMGPAGAEQLRCLLEPRRGVTFSVLEFAAGAHRSMSGSFTLLDFPGELQTVAYLPSPQGAHLVDDHKVVERLDGLYKELSRSSLSAGKSAAMAAAMSELEDSDG